MDDKEREAIKSMIERQQLASAKSKDAARESLMKSGLYNADGTLKAAYGGKGKTAA